MNELLGTSGQLLSSNCCSPLLPAIQNEPIFLTVSGLYCKSVWEQWNNAQKFCPAEFRTSYLGERDFCGASLHIERVGLKEEPLICQE